MAWSTDQKNLLEHHRILTPKGRTYLIQYILERERFNWFEFENSSSTLPNGLRQIVLEAQKIFEHLAIGNVNFRKNFEKWAKMDKIPRTQVTIMKYPKKTLYYQRF